MQALKTYTKYSCANKDEFEYLRNNVAFHEQFLDLKYQVDIMKRDMANCSRLTEQIDSVYR